MTSGFCITLFEEDRLDGYKRLKPQELEICHFNIDIKLIEHADFVRFVSEDQMVHKIFKDRFYGGDLI